MNDSESTEQPRMFLYFTVSLLVFAIETVLFLLPVSFLYLFVGHIIVVGGLSGFLALALLRNWDRRIPYLMTLFVATMGPFGAGICVVSIAMRGVFGITAAPLSQLLEELAPEGETFDREILYDRIIYGLENYHPGNVPVSFHDVMAFGSIRQKRRVLEKILRYFRPEFASALFVALDDSTNAIRVQAATVMSTLDYQFYDRFTLLEMAARKHPDSIQAQMDLAEHCGNYVFSQILDKDRMDDMQAHAIQAYENCLKLDPLNQLALLGLGRLHVYKGDLQTGYAYLSKVIEEYEDCSVETYRWLMRALYKMKDYQELRKVSQRYRERNLPDDTLLGVASLWGEYANAC